MFVFKNNHVMTDLKQQIFVAAHPNFFPEKGFELATRLAKVYEKAVCFLGIPNRKDKDINLYEPTFKEWEKQCSEKNPEIQVCSWVLDVDDDFTDKMEHTEASMIIFEITDKAPYNKPMNQLELCRQLRIPYFFVKASQTISFEKVLVPVGMLVEEREKGPFSSSLGRFFQSEILLMPANDYGSRARQNTEAIKTLLDKFDLKYQFIKAEKDSSKVEKEAAKRTTELNANMLMISASREYGMDDIIFGPKELKVIKQATVPVMVINPRADLYTLCG